MIFVTADIGANWNGDFHLLEFMLRTLKHVGINAIKFQALSPEILNRHPEIPYYEKASVTPENINKIDSLCTKYNIEWYATPTYPGAVKFLDPFVNRYKIRCADSENKEICDAVYATGKPVIVSSTRPMKFNDTRIKNLYCIPRYPTQFQEHNFNMIPLFDGFSNHCLNPLALLKSVMLGAKFIEFHITPSKDYFCLDNHVSFTPEEFSEIMRWIEIYEFQLNLLTSPGSSTHL